ncbi:hypothetical protein PBV87_08745 [Niameybacter massiliensis]|uniref:Uncharacterized protein n=1 Tax=Holtiella tumoricola TaxID=3018743 RepID=A0AA42DM90_9FIRM|nr:hypothetical protein [Holtiella tumoricola]MDA3731560.1 hypothetical protein [Holtiella tumoricola]
MKRYFSHKAFIPLLLTTALIFASSSLIASTTDTSSHDKIIQRFIDDIQLLQNQVFTLAQSTFKECSKDKSNRITEINHINSSIEILNKEILEYLSTLPSISSQNSDTLLVQNALNLVKNSLYQIDLLSDATTNLEQFLILQEFFRLRVNATETLVGLRNLLSY